MPRKAATPSTKDALLDEFQALVSDTEKLLQHSASLAGEQAEALRDDIRSSLDRARDTLHKAESGLREQGKIAVDATEDYVQPCWACSRATWRCWPMNSKTNATRHCVRCSLVVCAWPSPCSC